MSDDALGDDDNGAPELTEVGRMASGPLRF
jgi:hypothetical protein